MNELVDSITGWRIAVKGVGRATIVDGVRYKGSKSPVVQVLASKTVNALLGLANFGAFADVGFRRAESDVTASSLTLDVELGGTLDLEARFWVEGTAKTTKKNPELAVGFKIDRVLVGFHSDAIGPGIEILLAFDPIIGKGKPLSIQKLTNAINTKNSKNLSKVLSLSSVYTDNKVLLESVFGIDTMAFAGVRQDILNTPGSQAAFGLNWDSAPGTLFS